MVASKPVVSSGIFSWMRLLASCSLPVQAVVCGDLVSWTWRPFTFNVLETPCRITWYVAEWNGGRSRGAWRHGWEDY